MIKNSKGHRTLVALTVVCVLSAISHVSALTIGDSRDLGLIDKNQPADPTSSASFIDILLDQSLGSGPTQIGSNFYTRTSNDPLSGNYSAAVYTGATFGSNVTNINLGTGYQYLLAKYDGLNYGSVVWYVGGLTGVITIPLNGSGSQYAVSHTYLFNPTGTSVPDGGVTAMMLGFSFCGLGAVSRLLGRNRFRR